MKNKKAQLSMIISFVLAAAILIITYIVILVLTKGGADIKGLGFIESKNIGKCDYHLVNFLRADSGDGLSFSELLAFEHFDVFQKKAPDILNKEQQLGWGVLRWKLEVLDLDVIDSTLTPKFSIQELWGTESLAPSESCVQNVPSKSGNLMVKLTIALQ